MQEAELLASNERLSDAIVVVEETYPEKFNVSMSDYKRVLSYALEKLSEKDTKVFIKGRPNLHGNSSLQMILNDLDLSFEVLPKEVLAEGLFLNSQRLKVVGFVSSLLFYAKILGHESYSMLNMLQDKPASRFDRINGFSKLVDNV